MTTWREGGWEGGKEEPPEGKRVKSKRIRENKRIRE